MFQTLSAQVQPHINSFKKPRNYKGKLLSVDSTVIDLCLSLFPWAKFHHKKGAVKIHTLLDHDGLLPVFASITQGRAHDSKVFKELYESNPESFPQDCWVAMDRAYIDYELFGKMTNNNNWFVTRLKSNADYRVIESNATPEKGPVVSDEMIELCSNRGKNCGYYLRKVVVWLEDKKKQLILLTNNHRVGATTIASMYKHRWQIELFFKEIKQNLRIKSFVGTSENAVKTQIYCALCSIVLLRKLKSISDSKRQRCKQQSFSFSNMVTLLRISLFRHICLNSWLLNPFTPPPILSINQQLNLNLFGQQK